MTDHELVRGFTNFLNAVLHARDSQEIQLAIDTWVPDEIKRRAKQDRERL